MRYRFGIGGIAALAAVGLMTIGAATASAGCTVKGTKDNDTLTGTLGPDVICGRGGNDTLIGLDGNDILYGGNGNDSLMGGLGRDILRGDSGSDTNDGGPDGDKASFKTGAVTGAVVDLGAGAVINDGRGFSEPINGVENVEGTAFPDSIIGDAEPNRLFGSRGADTIMGGIGNDRLVGGPDGDQLFGGVGDDTVLPGPDPIPGTNNSADGDGGVAPGPGSDTIRYTGVGPPGVDVNLAAGTTSGAQNDSIANFENVMGSNFDDQLFAQLAGIPSLAQGIGGNDLIVTQDEDPFDTADGGVGADSCFVDQGDSQLNC